MNDTNNSRIFTLIQILSLKYSEALGCRGSVVPAWQIKPMVLGFIPGVAKFHNIPNTLAKVL